MKEQLLRLRRGLEKVIMKKPVRYAIAGTLSIAMIAGTYFLMQAEQAAKQITTIASPLIEAPVLTDVYEVTVDGKVLGIVPDEMSASELYEKAQVNLMETLGYDPEASIDYTITKLQVEDVLITPEATILEAMETDLYNSIDDIKTKAYVMKIGEDFVVSVATEEELRQVLENAESLYVNDDSAISVDFVQDERNSMVLVPEITVMQKELPEDRVFVTADMMAQITGDGSGEPMEDLSADDSEFVESVVKDIVLEQTIVVIETFVSESEIKTVEEATELITKENEKEKLYVVEKGDCPSIIAVENGMSTNDLYAMNPGLKENANKMQIGDEIVVMVPEPELFVTTVEDVIYTEVIDRDTTYVNNPDEYVGTNSVIEAGSDGILEVRATICKVNGKETDRVILEETILVAPTSEKILKGIKPLPVTTATGTFDMPLTSYTFMSGFGPRWGRQHKGIDLAAPTGTSVRAADGGIVIRSGWSGGYGYMIEIDHGNGLTTIYGHNSALYVSVGDEVAKYQTIAAVGSTGNSTGPHCHFEIRVNGTSKDPMNWLK